MDILKSRLACIWERETAPHRGSRSDGNSPTKMGVTFRRPMNISGTVLSPGRYEFRLLDPAATRKRVPASERNRVEFFNNDHTAPVAELTPELSN